MTCAIAVASIGFPARADDRYATAIERYDARRFGGAAPHVTVVRVASIFACLARRPCAAGSAIHLVVFADGDGAGEALVVSGTGPDGRTCPCLAVIAAGGGTLDARDLASYGLATSKARALLAR